MARPRWWTPEPASLGVEVKGFFPPEKMVARLGIKPEQVTKIIVTHMHFDHIGGVTDFAQAFPARQILRAEDGTRVLG